MPVIEPVVLHGEVVRLEPLGEVHVEALALASAEDPRLYQWSQVPIGDEAVQRFVAEAFGDPPKYATTVAVDGVPHHLADEPPDLLEAEDPVELGRTHRHLVPADLRHQRAALRVDEPRLAGGGPDARIALHPLHH